MKFLIVSTSPIIHLENEYSAYSPYVREMVIWEKYVDEVGFCCPIRTNKTSLLRTQIPFPIHSFFTTKEANLKSVSSILKAVFYSFYNVVAIFKGMYWADHIHLRCPGNIGLLGSIIQLFFPFKPKTAKYAGNWDPNSKQPWSYRLQKWIISNPILTRNIQVLVYGEWSNSSSNIKPFFTATYFESDKREVVKPDFSNGIQFIYVGTLTAGKNALYAIQLLEKIKSLGQDVALKIYGEGPEKERLADYIVSQNISDFVFLLGNQDVETVKQAYCDSHFVILPSKSEGWPKVVAEGMFWKCIPIASKVSCIPSMLDQGKRGVMLTMNLNDDVRQISGVIENQEHCQKMAEEAMVWSRKYTLDYFESQIKQLLQR